MHTYYELEFLGLEFHTLLSILTITHEMSVANVLLLEFYLLPLKYSSKSQSSTRCTEKRSLVFPHTFLIFSLPRSSHFTLAFCRGP